MPVDKKRKPVMDDDSDEDFAPSPRSPSSSSDGPPVEPESPAVTKPKKDGKKRKGDQQKAPDSGKKKPKEAALEYGVDITEVDQSPELTNKYEKMKNEDLKAVLRVRLPRPPPASRAPRRLVFFSRPRRSRRASRRPPTPLRPTASPPSLSAPAQANRMLVGGPKGTLVARCVDGELWGALPHCPRCHLGKLRVAYPNLSGHCGQGDWTCRGVFDKDLGANVRCYFTAGPGEVQRERWRDADDPAPEPVPPAAAADADAAPTDATLAEGFASMPGKDAAAEIRRVATALKFQLPTENILSEIGAKLMMTKNADTGEWDGEAALAALRDAYPPMSATEAAGGPPARCPENSGLASCLDKLVRLEKRAKGDAFKIKSYIAAAGTIRELDRVVTSGKAMAKPGPTKVAGIGKGIAAKIDEFLETGTMERITELEGEVGGVE